MFQPLLFSTLKVDLQRIALLVLCCLSYSLLPLALQAQVVLPATDQGPTQTSCEGTILDPGGTNDYSDGASSWVVIDPEADLPITFTFPTFDLGGSGRVLRLCVYLRRC